MIHGKFLIPSSILSNPCLPRFHLGLGNRRSSRSERRRFFGLENDLEQQPSSPVDFQPSANLDFHAKLVESVKDFLVCSPRMKIFRTTWIYFKHVFTFHSQIQIDFHHESASFYPEFFRQQHGWSRFSQSDFFGFNPDEYGSLRPLFGRRAISR